MILLPINYYLTELIKGFKDFGYGNGFMGAYVSVTIVFIIWTIITILFSKDRFPLAILFEKSERLILAVLLTTALILLLSPAPLVGICISVVAYTSLVLLSVYLNLQMFREIVLNK